MLAWKRVQICTYMLRLLGFVIRFSNPCNWNKDILLIEQLPFWNHLLSICNCNASKNIIYSFGWLWHLFEVIWNRIVVVAKLWAESFECVRKIKSTCVCCAWSVKKSKRQKNVYHVKLCSDVLADYANMNKNRKKVKKNINIPNFR